MTEEKNMMSKQVIFVVAEGITLPPADRKLINDHNETVTDMLNGNLREAECLMIRRCAFSGWATSDSIDADFFASVDDLVSRSGRQRQSDSAAGSVLSAVSRYGSMERRHVLPSGFRQWVPHA